MRSYVTTGMLRAEIRAALASVTTEELECFTAPGNEACELDWEGVQAALTEVGASVRHGMCGVIAAWPVTT